MTVKTYIEDNLKIELTPGADAAHYWISIHTPEKELNHEIPTDTASLYLYILGLGKQLRDKRTYDHAHQIVDRWMLRTLRLPPRHSLRQRIRL